MDVGDPISVVSVEHRSGVENKSKPNSQTGRSLFTKRSNKIAKISASLETYQAMTEATSDVLDHSATSLRRF